RARAERGQHLTPSLAERPLERRLSRAHLARERTPGRAPRAQRALGAAWIARPTQHRTDVHEREEPVTTAQRRADAHHRVLRGAVVQDLALHALDHAPYVHVDGRDV